MMMMYRIVTLIKIVHLLNTYLHTIEHKASRLF